MTCAHFDRDQICMQVNTRFSPFGHLAQVNAHNLLITNAWKTGGAFHYAKDSANFGGNSMEKFVSVSSDRTTAGLTSGGGPLDSVGIRRSIFDKPVLCPN